MNKTKCGRSLKETVSYFLLKFSMPFEVHLASKYGLLFVSPLRCSCNINIAAARWPGWHKLQMFMCQQVYTSWGDCLLVICHFVGGFIWLNYCCYSTWSAVMCMLSLCHLNFIWHTFFGLILRNHMFTLVL